MLATIHPRNVPDTWTGTWQRRAPEVSDCKPREDVCLQSALRIRQKDKRYWMSTQRILFDVIIQYELDAKRHCLQSVINAYSPATERNGAGKGPPDRWMRME